MFFFMNDNSISIRCCIDAFQIPNSTLGLSLFYFPIKLIVNSFLLFSPANTPSPQGLFGNIASQRTICKRFIRLYQQGADFFLEGAREFSWSSYSHRRGLVFRCGRLLAGYWHVGLLAGIIATGFYFTRVFLRRKSGENGSSIRRQ